MAAIFMSMGPSGAGKDTLLLRACKAFNAAGDTSVVFVKRHITRDPQLTTAIEVAVTEAEFDEQLEAGAYALHWEAHATRYAIPRAALEQGIAERKRMVINVSRTCIDQVFAEYAEARGIEVWCLNITASEATLRERLLEREREDSASVEARVRRAKEREPSGRHVIHIVNDKCSIVEGVQLVVAALKFGLCEPKPCDAAVEADVGSGRGGGMDWHLGDLNALGVAAYPVPPQLRFEEGLDAKLDTDMKSFAEEHGAPVAEQMRNVAKVCATCGKNCAVSLRKCNGCGESLASAKEQYTENVVMGFTYGVARYSQGRLRISMRGEDENIFVYDDPLARGTVHMNAVCAEAHLPDWRWLLLRPAKGRALLRRLREAADVCFDHNYWRFEPWRYSVLRPDARNMPLEEIQRHAIVALNAVPSQMQLHLHYIMPPLLPADYHQLLRGGRFTRGRWLPIEYVDAALAALEKASDEGGGLANANLLDTEMLFDAIETVGGPVYERALDEALGRYARSHERLAHWRTECFDTFVRRVDGADEAFERMPLHKSAAASGAGALGSADDDRPVCAAPDQLKALLARDKKLLQSYGKPLERGQAVPLMYYPYARAVGQVQTADEWADMDEAPPAIAFF